MSTLDEQNFISIRPTMDSFKAYIPYLTERGMNSDILNVILEDHEPIKEQLKTLRLRYEADEAGLPIKQRVILRNNDIESAINNKLNNAYDSEIVDTKIGYMLGNQINYTVEQDKVAKPDVLNDEIDKMVVRDNLADKDATLAKRAAIGGYGARLAYISVENDKPIPRLTNLKSEEVIFFYKETMSEPTFSLYYYDTVRINADGEKEDVTVAEFYNDTTVQRWVKIDGDFILESENIHGFLFNPLFGMENNDELTSETQKVVALINAFDRTLSDASNEIESSRLAILVLSELGINEDDLEKLRQSGVLQTYGQGTASYLTKNINDTIIQNHLEWLNRQIMRFTKTVDFSDEEFSSNLSGVAILFKTMALEHKTAITENKMRSTLQYQMKVLCSAWSLLNLCDPDDYLKIWFAFKRNLPHNTKDEAEATSLLKGFVSERTRLSLLPFIDNVEAEIEEMKREEAEVMAQLANERIEMPKTATESAVATTVTSEQTE